MTRPHSHCYFSSIVNCTLRLYLVYFIPLFISFNVLCTCFVIFCFRLGPGYVNVEEKFYSDPENWLNRRYPQTHLDAASPLPPTHLIMFNSLIQVVYLMIYLYLYLPVLCYCSFYDTSGYWGIFGILQLSRGDDYLYLSRNLSICHV